MSNITRETLTNLARAINVATGSPTSYAASHDSMRTAQGHYTVRAATGAYTLLRVASADGAVDHVVHGTSKPDLYRQMQAYLQGIRDADGSRKSGVSDNVASDAAAEYDASGAASDMPTPDAPSSSHNDAEMVARVTGLALDMARTVLRSAGGLAPLLGLTPQTHGRGMPALADAVELVTRAQQDAFVSGPTLTRPDDSGAFLRARLRHLPHEVFACVWLDNRHRVLAFEELFRGTIDGASVHPREVVKAALQRNAAAVIFAHNHPSGEAEPSQADRAVTKTLRDALDLVGVRVLDHLVIGAGAPVSMAARGLI